MPKKNYIKKQYYKLNSSFSFPRHGTFPGPPFPCTVLCTVRKSWSTYPPTFNSCRISSKDDSYLRTLAIYMNYLYMTFYIYLNHLSMVERQSLNRKNSIMTKSGTFGYI